jgi:AraC family transcriptional regulator, ethanolamine operon transcriptional activator
VRLSASRDSTIFDSDGQSSRSAVAVPAAEMTRRAGALSRLLQTLTTQPHDFLAGRSLSQVEAQIFEVILDMIPSAETIEPLHSRARIARAVLNVLYERL